MLQALAFQRDQACERWVVRFPAALVSSSDWVFVELRRPEIVWDEDVERKPGWEGHAGILNMLQGGESKAAKQKRLAIRVWLADLLNACQPFTLYSADTN